MRDLSVSVHFARAVLKHAVVQGVDVVSLLRRNRISPRLLSEDNARISIERFANLQVSTMVAMGDEALGYSPRRLPIGTWSMMCHAVIGSETLGQALHRYCRFFQLFEFGLRPYLEIDGEQAHVIAKPYNRGVVSDGYSGEIILFNAHRFASWLTQEFLPLQNIDISGTPQAQLQDYRHMYLDSPVQFERGDTRMTFSSSLLERRIVQNEQSLRHFLRHPVLIMLTQGYERNNWTSQVKGIIRYKLEQMPELNEVASQLDVHPKL